MHPRLPDDDPPFPQARRSNARWRAGDVRDAGRHADKRPIDYDTQIADVLSKMIALKARWWERDQPAVSKRRSSS